MENFNAKKKKKMYNNFTMDIKKNVIFVLIAAFFLIFVAVFYVASKNFSEQGAYVETKGLSEKIVKSDNAIWSINSNINGDDIDEVYVTIEKNIKEIENFLEEGGFSKDEISIAPLNIYENTYNQASAKYNANLNISVYTEKVDLVRSLSEKTRILIKKGTIISSNNINFEFSDLNSVKSEMIAESTKNAQKSAQEFAQNSGSEIGKLVRAKQGVFSIKQKDPGSPEYKKVRVVSTLRYLLK